jgi:hypothetical protein
MEPATWSGDMRGTGWLSRLLSYFGNDDPRLATAGSIALVIAGNQPFYPLYVFALAGMKFWPSLLTWITAPFFLAVPAVCRRAPRGGRWLLIAASLGNTVLTSLALGPASGVELFYLPCLILPMLLFAGWEAVNAVLACLAAISVGLLAVHGSGWDGVAGFDAATFASLTRLHAFSVAALLILFGFMAWRLWSQLGGRGVEAGKSQPEEDLDPSA